jgi:hypothetical protein
MHVFDFIKTENILRDLTTRYNVHGILKGLVVSICMANSIIGKLDRVYKYIRCMSELLEKIRIQKRFGRI